jgi:hypothetical protein
MAAARASVLPTQCLPFRCDGLGFSFALLLFFFLALAFVAAPYVLHGATRLRVTLSCGCVMSARPMQGPVRCHTCEQPAHQPALLSKPRMV